MKYVLTSVFILILGVTGIFRPIQSAITYVFVPIQFGLSKLAFDIKTAVEFYSNVGKVRNENLDLITQKFELEKQIMELKSMQLENETLRAQLELQKARSDLMTITEANVMGNPSDPSNSTIYIDRGSADGIKSADTVVVGPYLVGTVRSVNLGRSLVEVISSSAITFSVLDIDSSDKTEGLAHGRHGSVVSMEKILPNEDIRPDDTIVTTGKEGLFPRDLIVGKVIDVTGDPSQPLKIAQVRTGVNLSGIYKVFVVRPYNLGNN